MLRQLTQVLTINTFSFTFSGEKWHQTKTEGEKQQLNRETETQRHRDTELN